MGLDDLKKYDENQCAFVLASRYIPVLRFPSIPRAR